MKEKTDITFHEILVVFDRDPEIMVYDIIPTQLAWIASPKNTLNNQGDYFFQPAQLFFYMVFPRFSEVHVPFGGRVKDHLLGCFR